MKSLRAFFAAALLSTSLFQNGAYADTPPAVPYRPFFNCARFMEDVKKGGVVESYLHGEQIHDTERELTTLSQKVIEDLDLPTLTKALQQRVTTSVGKERIKWLLENPRTDSNEIRAIQGAVAELAQNKELLGQIKVLLQSIKTYERRSKAWEQYIVKLLAKIKLDVKFRERPLNQGIESFTAPERWTTKLMRTFNALLYPGYLFVTIASAYTPFQRVHAWTLAVLPASFGLMIRNASIQTQNRQRLSQLKIIASTADKIHRNLQTVKSPYLKELDSLLSAVTDRDHELDFAKTGRYIKNVTVNPLLSRFLDFTFISNVSLLRYTNRAYKEVYKFALMSSIIADLDVMTMFADMANEPQTYQFPTILDGNQPLQVRMVNGSNPALFFSGKPVVANNAFLTAIPSEGYTQIAFVTGPQARGKSTYIRTVALNALIAQAGGPVPGGMELTPMTIVSTIKNTDSTENDESRFRAEAKRVKELTDVIAQNPRALVFLDEVFSGTSNEEKLALEESLLRYLQRRGALVMVSSHSRGLVDLEGSIPGFRNFHASDSDERMFQIEPGPSRLRNAFKILKEQGVPDEIVDGAYSHYKGPNELMPKH